LEAALAIPQRAVVERQSLQNVYVVKPDNTVEVRSVQVGPRVGSYWVILKGLKAQEKVAVEGLQKLKPADKVVPKVATLKGLSELPSVPSGAARFQMSPEVAITAPAASQ